MKALNQERVKCLYVAQDKLKEAISLILKATDDTMIEKSVHEVMIPELLNFIVHNQNSSSIEDLIEVIEKEDLN